VISSLKSAVGGKLALPSLPPLLRNNLPLMLGLAVALIGAIAGRFDLGNLRRASYVADIKLCCAVNRP